MSSKHILPLFLFFSALIFSVVYAQLGEQAGQPFINVSVGSSGTFNYSILNSGSTPIAFKVILPTLNTIPHNSTPVVTVTPMNGTLAPNSQQKISISVYISGSDKPGLKWQGVLQVVEATPSQVSSGSMGAAIQAGVAKIVTITSAPPIPLPFIDYVIIVVIAAVLIIAVYLLLARRARTRKVAKTAKIVKKETKRRTAAKVSRAKAKAAVKTSLKTKAKTRRKRAAAKGARKTSGRKRARKR